MTNVWCVRAEFGRFARAFVDGAFVAIGWLEKQDLSGCATRDDLQTLYRAAYPQDTSNIVVGQQVGQIARFLLEIAPGDIVITPDANTELLHHGIVQPGYSFKPGDPACPYPHRRGVTWAKESMLRSSLSVPLQNTMRSSLTVFSVSQVDEVLRLVGRGAEIPAPKGMPYDPYAAVLEQVLRLDDKEFEILVGHLLTALGFEGSEVTGKTGDGGVDATGELNVANLAKVKVFVQAKRYKADKRIAASVVKMLRASIPSGGQGAFITTADFQRQAFDVALEVGFPRSA